MSLAAGGIRSCSWYPLHHCSLHKWCLPSLLFSTTLQRQPYLIHGEGWNLSAVMFYVVLLMVLSKENNIFSHIYMLILDSEVFNMMRYPNALSQTWGSRVRVLERGMVGFSPRSQLEYRLPKGVTFDIWRSWLGQFKTVQHKPPVHPAVNGYLFSLEWGR